MTTCTAQTVGQLAMKRFLLELTLNLYAKKDPIEFQSTFNHIIPPFINTLQV